MTNSKIFCFDLDGTICTNTFGQYERAEPFHDVILTINNLYKIGHTIKIYTARGTSTKKDWRALTLEQLSTWKVSYHELLFGKPEADVFVDDRSINISAWGDKIHQFDDLNSYLHNGILDAAVSIFRGTNQVVALKRAAELFVSCVNQGNKILWCGNGGSAADAQHLAAELVGRFAKNRAAIASIALTTDTSILTALSNDFGFETIFSRQIEAVGKRGDVLVCISTSGNSKNILLAAERARDLGITTIGFSGLATSKLDSIVNISVKAQSNSTSHIQESHICWGQLLCGYVENQIFQ